MKRMVLEAIMAGALVFLLIRLPLDLLMFTPAPDLVFLQAPPDAPIADSAARAASLSWWAAGATALLILLIALVLYGLRRADARHAEGVARLEGRANGAVYMQPRPATPGPGRGGRARPTPLDVQPPRADLFSRRADPQRAPAPAEPLASRYAMNLRRRPRKIAADIVKRAPKARAAREAARRKA